MAMFEGESIKVVPITMRYVLIRVEKIIEAVSVVLNENLK